MKSLLSIGTIILFAIFAVASIGPDGSTNTTVAIEDCTVKPPVSAQLQISVNVHREGVGSPPLGGAFGKLFITHQKVNSNDDCTYTVDFSQTIDFVCDMHGNFSYTGNTWVHNNSQDVIRVEFLLSASAIDAYGPQRETRALYYDEGHFTFSTTVFAPLL